MEPLSLRWLHNRYNTVPCFQYGLIKPTLFTVYTHQHYVVYSKGLLNLRCLNHGSIKLTLLTVWIHQPYVVYIMDPSLLRGLQYGDIKRTLFTSYD
jgi:hypothetical protein